MPGEKRPSSKLPDDVVARAKELRLADPRRWTVRALAAELGCGKSAIAEAIREEIVEARGEEDLELAEDLRATARSTLATLEAGVKNIGAALEAIAREELEVEKLNATTGALMALSTALDKAVKLARLVGGQSTENRSVRGRLEVGPAPGLTEAEQRALEGLEPEPEGVIEGVRESPETGAAGEEEGDRASE